MSGRVEGTVELDGLVEGHLPGDEELAADLRYWARQAARKLPLSLTIDGNHFSLLGENRPVEVAELGDDPARAVADALRELLDLLPPDVRHAACSTLRSMEYRKSEEVQTIYVIGPGGTVDVRQRTVDAETTAPPEPLTRKEMIRLGLTGLGVALLVFLVSSIFVDYRKLVSDIVERVTPLDPNSVAVDASRLAGYVKVVGKDATNGSNVLAIRLQRTGAFPKTDAALRDAVAAAGEDLPRRLALEALARGYVRCEMFDKDRQFLGYTMHRIVSLRGKPTTEIALRLPAKAPRPARIVLTY